MLNDFFLNKIKLITKENKNAKEKKILPYSFHQISRRQMENLEQPMITRAV